MKTKRFDFNFRPLQINVAMSVEGGVPDVQTYNADTDEYTPDYSIDASNLIIQPRVGRLDKDEVLTPGAINAQLTNIKWEQIVNGKRVEIVDVAGAKPDFVVERSGRNAGKLTIKTNVKPQIPLNLVFSADYPDPRTGQVYHVERTKQIICRNATTYTPILLLDAAEQTIYNPLNDPDVQVVHASLRLGDTECPAEKRIFVWEVMREDGTYTAVGADTTLDYDVDVSDDTASCSVDRSIMGDALYLRCRAKYDIGGNPSSVALQDSAPSSVVAFIRRLPKYEYDIGGLPTNISSGVEAIAPEAVIYDTNGIIENAEKELLPTWYAATNAKSGSLSYSLVAHGAKPIVSTEKMDSVMGAVYGLDVKDVGGACAWEDSDGAVFVDDEGSVILIK